ncbi:aldo/keto reductase [Streptomyces olivoverticillatus]
MKYRPLGNTTVSAIGLGAMPLSIENRPDEERAVATIHAALDAGITLIDTADSYHWHADECGHNELLIARALARYGGDTSDVLVATKGGRGRPGDGGWTVTGTPPLISSTPPKPPSSAWEWRPSACTSCTSPTPTCPGRNRSARCASCSTAGTIRAAGISNVTTGQIREAHAILGDALVSVQNQYSPAVRDTETELELSTRLGLAFLPWSPLGGISRSSLDGPSGPTSVGTAFHRIAAERGVSPQQIALAWLLARSPAVIPVPGASRPASIQDSAKATEVELEAAELAELSGLSELEAALPN